MPQSVGTGAGLNQIGVATRTWYAQRRIDVLHEMLRILPYAALRPLPPASGQTISWRKPSRLAAKTTPLTEGSPPAASNISWSEVTATVQQYGDYVEMTDHLVATGPDPFWTTTAELQGRQVALTFDALVQAAALGGTNVLYGGDATSRGTVDSSDVISATVLDQAIETLLNNHVPFQTGFIAPQVGTGTVPGAPAYISIITPSQWRYIKLLSGVDKAETYASDTSRLPGEVGKFDNIRFILSTTGYVAAGAGAGSIDVQTIAVFGQDAFARTPLTGKEVVQVIREPDTSPDSGDPLSQVGSLGWKSWFTSQRLDEDRIVRLEFALG